MRNVKLMRSATPDSRDRLAVGVALAGIGGVAWFYLIFETERFAATGICHCASTAIGGPNLEAWAPQTLLPLLLMWVEMMVAMMLPAVAPLVLLFSKVARSRAERGQLHVPTIFFVPDISLSGQCSASVQQLPSGPCMALRCSHRRWPQKVRFFVAYSS